MRSSSTNMKNSNASDTQSHKKFHMNEFFNSFTTFEILFQITLEKFKENYLESTNVSFYRIGIYLLKKE